jgi:hypothetical protein
VNVATSKNLVVKNMMFLHQNVHKYTWTSRDGKNHNQIDNILTGRKWHLRILHVPSFREAHSDPDHYLVVAKVREILTVSKQADHVFDI